MKGYRKFAVTAAALAGGFVLALFGKLTGDFTTIATVCVGAFHASHAIADRAFAAAQKD
jgi:hypothetical protein